MRSAGFPKATVNQALSFCSVDAILRSGARRYSRRLDRDDDGDGDGDGIACEKGSTHCFHHQRLFRPKMLVGLDVRGFYRFD